MLDVLRRNIGLKILSLFIAYTIWASVGTRDDVQRTIEVPLDVVVPEELILRNYEPKKLQAVVRGDELLIRELDPLDMRAVLNPGPNAAAGDLNVAVGPEVIENEPRGVVVQDVVETSVSIQLEQRMTRDLPVVARFEGEPSPGFRLGEVSVSPTTLRASGAESVVSKLEELSTLPIDLSGRRTSFTVQRPVEGAETGRRGLTITPEPRARVRVEILELDQEQSLTRAVIAPEGFVASPSEITVVLSCPPSLLPQVEEALTLRALRDEGADPPGRARIVATLDALSEEQRSRVSIVGYEPETVVLRPQP